MKFFILKDEPAKYFIRDAVKTIVWWLMVVALFLSGGTNFILRQAQDEKINNYKMVAKACINYDHIEARVETVDGSNRSNLFFYCR